MRGKWGQVVSTTYLFLWNVAITIITNLGPANQACFFIPHFPVFAGQWGYKSFHYCQFRHIMLKYRYQQGRQTNRFVLPCLHRRGTLARVARERSRTEYIHIMLRGINQTISRTIRTG